MKLKGKTIIELTDVKTGEVKVTEETNFITNAIRDICQPILRNQDALPTTAFISEGSCTIEALMRGLLLFDKKLDENASNYFPPTSAKMIGHCGEKTYLGTDLSMGSFNVNQSNLVSDTERSYVWDFTTEQANGIINSICLTTQAGGTIGHGSDTASERTTEVMKSFSNIIKSVIYTNFSDTLQPHSKVPVYLSFENDCLVYCDFSKVTTGTMLFYKVALSSKTVDIFKKITRKRAAYSWEDIVNVVGYGDTEIEVISFSTPDDFGTGTMFGLAQDGQYMYITSRFASSESNEANGWAAGNVMKILKVDLESFTSEVLEVTNTTGVTLAMRVPYSILAENCNTFGVSNGFLFAREWVAAGGSSAAELYAINLSDNTDVKKVEDANGGTKIVGVSSVTSSTPFVMSMQGKVVFTEINQVPNYKAGSAIPLMITCCVSTDDFKLKYLNTPISSLFAAGRNYVQSTGLSTRVYPTSSELYFGFEQRATQKQEDAACYVCVFPNVLMTINNLTSPIEKTPAQTMRITYKLIKE